MSPMQARSVHTGGQAYVNPFVGPNNYPAPVRVDLSTLFGSDWLDDRGFLKPGTPFTAAGALVAAPGAKIHGCLFESTQVVNMGSSQVAVTQAALDAAGDRNLIVSTIGQLNVDIVEDNLGRALNADELAAFVASATIKLI